MGKLLLRKLIFVYLNVSHDAKLSMKQLTIDLKICILH